jgi:hypothetical protein
MLSAQRWATGSNEFAAAQTIGVSASHRRSSHVEMRVLPRPARYKGGEVSALPFCEHQSQSHPIRMSRPSFAYQQPFVVNLPGSPSSKSPAPGHSSELQDSSNTYKTSKLKSSLKAAFLRPFRSSSSSESSPASGRAPQSSNIHSLVSVPSKHKPKDKSGNSHHPGHPMPGVRMTFV